MLPVRRVLHRVMKVHLQTVHPRMIDRKLINSQQREILQIFGEYFGEWSNRNADSWFVFETVIFVYCPKKSCPIRQNVPHENV